MAEQKGREGGQKRGGKGIAVLFQREAKRLKSRTAAEVAADAERRKRRMDKAAAVPASSKPKKRKQGRPKIQQPNVLVCAPSCRTL